MRCGLFGKLPAKRDFIAIFAPRALLDVWEPWMQSGISASRETMRDGWRDAFLTAPIWRFWLGAEICGITVTGAFMSSLDGVGRYYPLTVFACADPGAPIPPPELDAQDEWFAAAEEFLLSTLHHDVAFDAITAALDRLAAPHSQPSNALPEGMTAVAEGSLGTPAVGHPFADLFGTLRTANHVSTYAAATFWWTLGGDAYPPFALSCRGMPTPFLFANMMTGRFAAATA
jgi:type VI secretion system protein ImpM